MIGICSFCWVWLLYRGGLSRGAFQVLVQHLLWLALVFIGRCMYTKALLQVLLLC